MLNLLVLAPMPLDTSLAILGDLLTGHARRVCSGGGSRALGLVAADNQEPHQNEEKVEDDVEAEVGRKALAVARRVAVLEDLGRRHVARGPADEGHGQGGGFLGLAGDVAGDEGEDEVALGDEELSAVEGDQEADAIGPRRRDAVDYRCADDRGAGCGLVFCLKGEIWDLHCPSLWEAMSVQEVMMGERRYVDADLHA